MKRFIAVFCALFVLAPSTLAFRDISPNSSLLPAIENLVNRGVLTDKGFFRPDAPVPAKMFWEVILRDAGFDPNSAQFGTPLPPNIKENDPLAQFLREAIRRGFISVEEPFDGTKSITRLQAIKTIVKTKAILPPKKNSKLFMKKISGVSPRAKYLKEVEAALASEILEQRDIDPLRPFDRVTRRDFVTWLYRFDDHGMKKSSLEKSRFKSPKIKKSTRSSKIKKRGTQKDMKIEILTGRDLEDDTSFDIPNGRVLKSVFNTINDRYKFSEQLTTKKKKEMIDAAIAAMVKALGDKYSSYIEPAKVKEFKDDLNGKFEGIGAHVEMFDDGLTITAPLKGSPAEKAGILPGDVIIKVDGDSIEDKPIREIVDLIRGPKGTTVTLTVTRDGIEIDIPVVRGEITVPSITLEWKNSIPIIGVHQFDRKTARDFAKILKNQVLIKRPRGIVLDLRNNPGGYLTSAVDMGEFFLNKGELIFSVEYKDGDREYRASRTGELADFTGKIVVLQNKGSASASEILAGMLQDYEIAKIIGEASTGKGTVQEINNYANGSTLKLTIAKWLTPKKRWIHEKGVTPDREVSKATSEERKKGIDRQLDTAVREVLKGK